MLMLLDIMPSYLMLFTALSNDVCLYNACLFIFFHSALDFCIAIIYTNAFCFHAVNFGLLNI